MDPSLKSVTFTTDYCEGRSVSYALDNGYKFSINQALTITADILDALAYLHEDQRLLHRDIKPGNVMLTEGRRRALIGDFGSAALFDEHRRAPAGAGTPLYIPPEAASGSLDQGADLYGTGMVLLEMLNGPFPYDDLDRVARDKIDERIAQGRRSLPDKFFMPNPWIPRKAAMLVRSLCAADPNDRPVSAAAALREIGDAQCVDWRRTDGDGVTGCWRGQWPPNRPVAARREFEVTVDLIEKGPYRGKLLLRAAWRKPPASVWRRYAKLETRIAADDLGALRRFFRAVEAEAQSAPTQ
jgi:serine/threonine protein kinase